MGTAYGETETITAVSDKMYRVEMAHGTYGVKMHFGCYWSVFGWDGGAYVAGIDGMMFGSKDAALRALRSLSIAIG